MADPGAKSFDSTTLLRCALGLVYFHFGVLKFYPDLSPAELVATQTVMAMSLQWISAHSALLILAALECVIGLAFLFDLFPRVTFVLFLAHMLGTFLPLLLLPELTFKIAPFAPNFEGQYILKNIVFVAAGWTILLPRLRQQRAPQQPPAASPTSFPSALGSKSQ